jgi:hypothetical protein
MRAWRLIPNKKIVLDKKNCHGTEKSEVIASCKEMPVIRVNKVVDKKRIIGKRVQGGKRRSSPRFITSYRPISWWGSISRPVTPQAIT